MDGPQNTNHTWGLHFKWVFTPSCVRESFCKDVTVKDDFVHLYLGQTKTSCGNASVDAVHFRHHQVALLLKSWLSSASKDDFWVPDSSAKFRSWLSRALKETGLHSVGYKPYSLRRGGATYIFGETQSYSAVAQHGRWGSQQTVRVYIADSLALLNDIKHSLRLPQHMEPETP